MSLRKIGRLPATKRDLFFGSTTALAVLVLVTACGAKGKKAASSSNSSSAVVKDCVLPAEQQFSIQGHWGTTPIKVSIHAADFDPGEVTAIQTGGKTWNTFFTASKGFNIFDLGADGIGNQSTNAQSAPACNGGTLSDGTVLYKRFSNWTHSAQAIAVTTTCFTPSQSGGLATIFNAIMEFNYVNFFAQSSGRFPDIQSIALHELGHLLGLDHSCGALGRPNQANPNVSCPDSATDPNNPLLATVMFPQVFFDQTGAGEVKQALTTNDQGRANCAY
ncbi:MAG: hypothetical protein HY075_14585 [Deltaproteobacteria bacterium]|nr:hypothetical protein [Deltaproteobacteria bacterium]